MGYDEIIEVLEQEFEEVPIFKNFDYKRALIGHTHCGRAVYRYDLMIKSLIIDEGFESVDDAVEWIEYNTIRALPYMGSDAPIIFYDLTDEELY